MGSTFKDALGCSPACRPAILLTLYSIIDFFIDIFYNFQSSYSLEHFLNTVSVRHVTRGVFRALSNIYDGAFFNNCQRPFDVKHMIKLNI